VKLEIHVLAAAAKPKMKLALSLLLLSLAGDLNTWPTQFIGSCAYIDKKLFFNGNMLTISSCCCV
jgi:hypothetical protein